MSRNHQKHIHDFNLSPGFFSSQDHDFSHFLIRNRAAFNNSSIETTFHFNFSRQYFHSCQRKKNTIETLKNHHTSMNFTSFRLPFHLLPLYTDYNNSKGQLDENYDPIIRTESIGMQNFHSNFVNKFSPKTYD